MNGLKWDPLKDWDPVRELEEFQNRLGSYFGRGAAGRKEGELSATEWSPLVDILEDDREFLIKADLPDVKREDVHVMIENHVLIIRGERRPEASDKGKRYHRSERSYGTFARSFVVPETIKAADIQAEYKDGLLKIHLRKGDGAKPKEIEVKVE